MKACLLALLAVSVPFTPRVARADEPALADPDSEVSRRTYDRGFELYSKGDYRGAIVEFQAANEVRPAPALLYDIARCYDRLGEWQHALDAYRRFWDVATPRERSTDVRTRIDTLSARLDREHAPLEHARQRRWRIAGYTLGAAALASFAVGGAMYGWAAADRPGRAQYCASLVYRNCVGSELSDLYARQNVSYALFALGGALAVADIAVWTVELLHERRERRHLSLGTTGNGFAIGGSF